MDVSILKTSRNLLLLLLAIDMGFIILHIYNSILIPDDQFNDLFSLVQDSSLAEYFQYIKWLIIAFLFFIISNKQSTITYIAWALLFIYLLLDDSLELHEKYGADLIQFIKSTPPLGLRKQDIGELIVTAVAGGFLFTLLAWAYFKGSEVFKKVTKEMLILIAVLGVFGVLIDMLSSTFSSMIKDETTSKRLFDFLFGILEDGGEMFIASIMLWYVFIVSKVDKDGLSKFLQLFKLSILPAHFQHNMIKDSL